MESNLGWQKWAIAGVLIVGLGVGGVFLATGQPTPHPGIFTLGPFDNGFVVETGSCIAGNHKAIVGNDCLCETGVYNATMESAWQSPSITGVVIRLRWNEVHLAAGTADANFDFAVLDREIDNAVQNGKLYSLVVRAGKIGTPDWIFSKTPVMR